MRSRSERNRPIVVALLPATLALLIGCSSSDEPSSAEQGRASSESTRTPTTAVKTSTTDRPPDEPGTYGVGRTTVTLVDNERSGRTLTTDVWYPIEAAPEAPPSLYQFDAAIPAIDLDVAKADQPIAPGGPFPVIVFSHGSPSIRYQSLFFTELLASHGFVVAAPDHAGDSAVDALSGSLAEASTMSIDRPADISFVIDAVLGGAVDEPAGLADAVDADRIGIVGHSGGGDTVLAVTGGRSGAAADDRVKAVLAWTPSTAGLNDESLSAIDQPTMLVGATLDDIAPIEPNVERAWAAISGRPLYRVDITGGGHDQFTNVCDFLAAADSNPDFPAALRPVVDLPAADACTPEFIPIEDAHRIISRFGVAFLELHVAGNADAATWLTSAAAAKMPDVTLTLKE